jgi:uncharacterized protein RhaS with RHS repeats
LSHCIILSPVIISPAVDSRQEASLPDSFGDVFPIIAGNAPKYLLYDGHGSIRQLVNNTGATVLEAYSYDAYGVMLGGNPGSASNPDAPATSLLYAGEQFDIDAQQYYFCACPEQGRRTRCYDPATGRFNRTDPFAGNHSDR